MGAEMSANRERDIAVIGMAARFPQSETLDALWDNLSHNRLCTEPVPDERWDAAADGGQRPFGGFLRGVEYFDARLFNISPREAREMDPQQRLFLEMVWSALEDAGYGQMRQRPQTRVGLFVGSMWHDYSLLSHERGFLSGEYAGAGAPTWAVANRISFALKLAGPSLAVNTACSSSLLAIHLACQSLRNGECELAIAGGVNLHLHPGKFRYLREETLLAEGGEKACFTPGSEGYVPGEGVGAVLLKPLARALADGDHIDAVIRASGTNHNGGGMFFKVPNAAAQADLIKATWREADIDPGTLSYIEMSAYGSEMVDAAELAGLSRAFPKETSPSGHCALGTLKPNLGHLEAASGVAQLIKVVLQLRNRQLLPARFAQPSDELKLDGSPFVLQRQLAPWNPAGDSAVRRAAISSFGAGGTNVHVVIEEAPAVPETPSSNESALIVISALDAESLRARVSALQRFLDDDARAPGLRLEDFAWTLQAGREEMRERLAFVASSIQEVREQLARFSGAGEVAGMYRGSARSGTSSAPLRGPLEQLAAHWVQGGRVEWPRSLDFAPRRISLPTYPFNREPYWLGRDLPAQIESQAASTAMSPQDLVREYLRSVIGAELGLPGGRTATDLTFEELGFDSLLIKRLNVTLERDLGPVSKTLFFRYRTIDELAAHLSASFPAAVERLRSQKTQETSAADSTHADSARRQIQRLYEPTARAATQPMDIAIIGLAGRYPGADSLQSFWEVLREGRDCITEVPADRWPGRQWFEPIGETISKSYSKWGGFLEGVDQFDPLFFDISPREAALMDPQERLFLETAWHAIEDAGYTPAELAKQRQRADANVGVFVGVMWSEYQFFGVEEAQRGRWISPSSAFWSVPNRISFCFDFDGPSLALDTACSSSLVAIHLACESLRRRECATALAGGVSLSLHPMKYIGLSQKRFAATDGRCRSFGAGGDGYVPGEGVGAVLLKPLRDALADGDSIHGVIKGTHVNHGGRTNGYTVPSPRAQGALIAAALRKARIDARSIGYVEAHGTGTSLGDPIEVDGLSEAFGSSTRERQSCALGSVKSNIGHLESAAGIAGLTKVLLQLRHRQIAPSLHSAQLNPNIDFAATPFNVPQELSEWKSRDDAAGEPMPRRAGISSFGAGGVNAHVIVEEWTATPALPASREIDVPKWFVFSARDTDRLRELVAHFVEFAAQSEFDAENAAYTLKVGRTHFEERLAVAAANGVALASKLRGWLSGAPVDGLISGSARRPQQSGMVESSDEGELVRAWIAGADVNWTRLYDGAPRKRIHLPTYRFARERHWVTLSAAQPATALPALHPMIDANCSSFEGLAFRKTFLATDSIVRDHVISGRHIVPGVAWIEMMLAAAEMASGRSAAGIEEFTWRRPVECEPTSGEVRLRITLEDDSRARCELSVESESRNELIARGTAIWSDGVPLEQLRRDIAQVRASCEQHRDEAFCYRALKQAGLDYGPALRGLRDLFLGDAVMLARLAVAPSETADARIKLPVALLDGAFQAAALTAIGALPANANTLLPLRFGALRVYGPAPSEAWAVIERRVPESDANENLFVYDLVLTDADGTPWADVRGFTLKAARPAAASMLTKVHLFRPEWITMPLSNAGAQPANVSTRVLVASSSRLPSVPPGWDVLHVTPGTSFSVAADQIALDPRDPEHFTRLWQSLSLREWHPDLVLHLWTFSSPAASASGAPEDRLTTLFNLVSTGLRTGWAKRDVQWLHVYPSDDGLGAACSAAIAGFARSVQLEQPRCRGRVMAVAQDLCDEAPALWSAIQAELAWTEGDVEIRIDERRREVRRFVAWSPPLRDLAPGALRRDGAWVLTGGAGGLGLIFAEEMLRLGVSAIVLVGRKAPDAGLEQRLIELRAHSAQVEYVAADITDQLQVQALLASVRQRHGCIRGVIHSAAVLRDAFVLKKTPDAFASVLAPKIRGAIHLDLATRDDDLDAFVLFSSTAAVTGNAGQADYAAGNRFMDELATWRNQQTASGHRRGAAISIAWPLWREGGMQVNEVAERALRERLGMTPLSTQNGLVAFRTALANRIEQLVVVEGETADVTAAFASAPAVAAAPLAPVIAGTEADVAKLRAEVERYLRSLVAQESGVAPGRLEPDAPLERYGLDSVMVMSLNRHLEKDLPGLSKTLLYEYQTLAALTDHLLETRAQQLQAKFAPASSPVGTAANVAAVPKATPPFASRAAAVDDVRPLQAQPDASDIAIIGVSGRYPHAREWRDLWTVLAAGRDCITEIPPERWDYRRYYDPVKGRPGRTYGKWGGFIDGHDEFDPLFFNISPREAEMMDPQERLFLQAAWHAIEDAGYRKSDLEREPVGVFAGAMWAHYQMVGVNECLAGAGEAPTALHASIANRVSYCFNFRGPSISLDTMCSSSLTALHLACESLRRDECTVALAGGVNVCAHPVKYQLLAQNGMLATDGRCRSFGARGDGYVPGEGVGVLLLKPLHQALRDGDHVYGVIKGSVVNHGGKTNGYTVPNPLAQADVIRTALRRAAVEPASISYVEAHGTGTALGDPIEINGLERAFAGAWPGAGSCAVGSIKSNIGHLESAAGVAAITKVLLQFMHEKLAPSLHSTELNPNIDFSRSPFRVVRDLEDWARPSSEADVTTWPRRAGVSSFGAGGANAHVVLEEAPAAPVEPADAMPQLIVLSAKNPERLQAAAEKLAAWFEEHGRAPHRPSLADIAWTLQIGREEMDTRVAFVARDYEEARELALRVARAEQDDARLKRGERSDLVGVVRALLDGAAGQAFVAQLFSTCDWNKLAELWVAGLAIDWRRLHTRPHRRVPLPGYRFSAQRFWVPNVVADASAPVQKQTPRAAIPAVTTTTTLATGDLPEDLFLVRDWRPVARLGAVDEEPGVRGLLLVNAECPSALVDEARRRQWLIVQAGSELHFDPLGTSTMDFSSAEHGRLMMERILSAGPPLNAAIDLADVWSEPREAWTVDMGRVTLLQGCLSAPSRGPLQWLHVTNGVHTFSHSAPSMAGAAMAGLVKMLSAECSRVRAQTADLERSPATFDDVRAIWAGARSGPADEVEVCYRGGVRYVPGFRRLQLAPTAELPRIREDRAYLITGGTSGLGLEVARHLVARGARRLALMGINPLPSRAKWSEILATADARTRRRLETFAGFERDGVSIETHFGALDDGDAVASFIARVTQQLGPIAGVVHSATATFNRPDPYFISKTSEEIHGVLAPKLEGTRQLAALLEHQALDFFVLFSSVASALPSRGQGVSHYAMANSFLDRFAEQQAARGHRQIKCINWVYWGEAGGVAGDEHARKLARYGIFAQTNSEGLASFDRALAMHAPRVLAGRLGDTLRAEARLDDAICRETATEETSLGDAAVLEQCAIHHAQGLARLGSERTSQSELSEYAALALLRAMRSRRVLTAAGRRYGVAELAAQLGVVERQTRLWRALLALLAKKQFIHFVDADNFVSADRLESDALNEALASLPALGQSFASRHAGFASYIRLIDTAMASVWEVLRAERSATDILFARGSVELVEAVYQGNPISDHFNHLLARAAYEWLSAGRSSGRRLRVLEVGAGTGGTSARVLDALRPLASQIEYVYTDISSRFIQHGESRFGRDYPFATFRTLDIERSLDAQGFASGEFDLVLATNVMHATRRLDRSLGELQRLLRPGGLFLLNELTEVHDFATVTFGLLDGWWQFDDEVLRLRDAPLLSESSWRAALRTCGFDAIRTWTLPSLTEAEGNYQTLFAAVAGARRIELVTATPVVSTGVSRISRDVTPTTRAPASLEQEITEVLARELKIPAQELGPDVEFGEYGVDSILIGTLVRALEERLNVSVNPSLLLENNTLSKLSRRLQQELPDAAHAVVVESPRSLVASSPPMSNAGKIAVIGLSCDFPGAPNLETYWWNLKEGRCAIQEVPAERWRVSGLYSSVAARGKSISKWGGFVENVAQFDPEYFKFRDSDAAVVNPLIRKLLESAVQAVCHAGYKQGELWGQRAGVFVGTRINEYGLQLHGHHKNRILGAGQNFVAAHLSQFLNLRGPSLVVDSACSSSLVSLHLACQSLLSGDSTVAFAGGVDLLLDERPYLILSEMGALSPEGRCRTFDERANGFVPGEGCGVVMLKTLEAALADGDAIYAVIDGSAVNNDGHTMGVTTPSPEAQSAVITEALKRSGVDPRTIGYVETHGTGTLVGDPIELQALTRVLAAGSTDRQFCGVGSVKSNFGHLLSAAGIASFIKVVLGLGAGKIPPTLFCDAPNPRFSFPSSPLYPVRELTPWPRHGELRRAGVSSFGLGGTNAHVIVSEAPLDAAASSRRQPLPPIVFKRRRFWSEATPVATMSRGSEVTRLEPVPVSLPSKSLSEADSTLELIEDAIVD